jgi:glycosyltransferase involved in cell wall biosynthesis
MRIGFDAKRFFLNYTGLGNYSRNLVYALSKYYPGEGYYLYTPSTGKTVLENPDPNLVVVKPEGIINKVFHKYWRSVNISDMLERDNIDVYHGLSCELPVNTAEYKYKKVVTVHDLIFIRNPKQYKPWDRAIYKRKTEYAARNADVVVAISKETKNELVNVLNIDPGRIEVVYQSCNPIFYQAATEEKKGEVQRKYNLPSDYILSVGTIQERKNQLALIKAVQLGNIDLPVVFIGKKTRYYRHLRKYIQRYNMRNIFFQDNVSNADLPSLYQMSSIFAYVSFTEGFGIPIIEALHSGVPVITSRGGCFEEAGGDGAVYCDPDNPGQIAEALKSVLADNQKKEALVAAGREHISGFTDEMQASRMVEIYNKLLK